MSKSATVLTMRAALTRERRSNRRLREVIENIREDLRQNRHDLNLQFTRLAQLQAEIDALKAEKRRLGVR